MTNIDRCRDTYAELMGSLKLGNVWGFVQLVFGPGYPMNKTVCTIRDGTYFRATAITRKILISQNLIRLKALLRDGSSCSLGSHLVVICTQSIILKFQPIRVFRVIADARKVPAIADSTNTPIRLNKNPTIA